MSTTSCLRPQLSKPKPSSATIFFNTLTDKADTKSNSVFTTPPKQPCCSLPTLPSHMTQSSMIKNLVRPL